MVLRSFFETLLRGFLSSCALDAAEMAYDRRHPSIFDQFTTLSVSFETVIDMYQASVI